MTKVKICGITNWEDARLAVDLGADFLGFIFVDGTPRATAPEIAAAIRRKLPKRVETVAVVRNLPAEAAMALREASGCGWVQLHGDEPPETVARFYPRVIRAFSTYRHGVATFRPFAGAVLLLDRPKQGAAAPRGGRPPSRRAPPARRVSDDFLRLGRRAKRYGKVLLAGGLAPDTVGEWVARLRPWGVDVVRGVEAFPGKKNPAKMRAFFDAVRKAGGE